MRCRRSDNKKDGQVNGERLHCIPKAYAAVELETATLYCSPQEAEKDRFRLENWTTDVTRFVTECVGFQPRRHLHVCAYHTVDDARECLGRTMVPTFAMAPFASETDSVVTVHSALLDPLNGDALRMRRLIAHEVTHQAIAELTGSTKVLGDGNRGMHVSTWLNEGLAEMVGWLAVDAGGRLSGLRRRFEKAPEHFSFGTLSARLDDLDHPARASAFDHVTAAVCVLSEDIGLRSLFAQLPRIDAAFGDEDPCSPRGIRAGLRTRG